MAVEAGGVDLEQLERLGGDRGVDLPSALDLGEVANPAEEAVGDAGCPAPRPAMVAAPSSLTWTPRMPAERSTIRVRSSGA